LTNAPPEQYPFCRIATLQTWALKLDAAQGSQLCCARAATPMPAAIVRITLADF
jgi:hypothetical protein